MILVAENVLHDISRRADELAHEPSMTATRSLPGYAAYEYALQNRLSATPPDRSLPETASTPAPRDTTACDQSY